MAYAWFWTAEHQRKLSEKIKAARAAKAAGDMDQFRKLNQALAEEQKKSHRQVFSTAPADEALAAIKERIPEIQKQADVSMLVSKWDEQTLKRHASAEKVDLTDLLTREFKSTEKQFKTIEEIRRKKPVPLNEIDKVHD